jgi:hypothetical protein
MTNFTTIDALSLSTVTGGKNSNPQPQNPNCVAFCGTTIAPKTRVTGVKTGPINYTSTDQSKPKYHGTGAGAKVELGNPLPIGEAT